MTQRIETTDYTDVMGTMVQFPHCDALILHHPGTCVYCDGHPDWQALRSAQGIAFSNDTSEFVKTPLSPRCRQESAATGLR